MKKLKTRYGSIQISLIIFFLVFCSGCIPIWERFTTDDLSDIKQRGKLQVITAYSANSYFIYKGEPMGYEYELVKRLADHLGVDLEIIVSHDIENVPFLLNSSQGDLVAASIAVTGERVREIQFTEPLMMTRQVLVQRIPTNTPIIDNQTDKKQDSLLNRSAVDKEEIKPGKDEKENSNTVEVPQITQKDEQSSFLEDAASVIAGEVTKKDTQPLSNGLIKDPIELLGKTIFVRTGSASYQRLKHLEKDMGGKINIQTVPGNVITEDLIRRVTKGDIEYTIADEPTALTNRAYYNNINVSTAISFPQRIAWVVRPNAKSLLKEINLWINSMKRSNTLAVIHNRYYKNPRGFRTRVDSEYYSEAGESISIYDDLIKEVARSIDWDWRLLASLIYQESRFNPRARSWAGASGLMQLMPATGRSMGAKNLFSPDQNLKAGTRYLKAMDKRWKKIIKDPEQRLNFILASYNAGPGHVDDARYLAKYYNKDPDIWEDNVAEFMLKLSDPAYYGKRGVKYGYCRGEEPYNYVTEIKKRYKNYQKFFDKEEQEDAKEPGPKINA